MKILFSPILIALALLQSGLICDRRPTTSDCEPLASAPSAPFLMVTHQARLFGGELTVRFDTVLSDDRCDGAVDSCSGLAVVRLRLTTSGGDTANIDMEAYSDPPFFGDGPFHTVDTLGYYITLLQLWSHQSGPRPLPYRTYTLQFEAIRKDPGGGTGKVVVPATADPASVLSGDYEVDTAYIRDDSLHMKIAYGGGCEPHYFVPYLLFNDDRDWVGERAMLVLHHLNNFDWCEAYLTRDLAFDLSPIKRLCRLESENLRSRRSTQICVYEYAYDSRISAYGPHLVSILEYRY